MTIDNQPAGHTAWSLDGDHNWSECSVQFEGSGSHYTVYAPGQSLPVAFVIDWPDSDARDRARLIASAPDLLEALKGLLSNAELARFYIKNTEEGEIVASALFDTINEAHAALRRAQPEQSA